MAGSTIYTSPTRDWAGQDKKLGTCHGVPGKWDEDTARKLSEIISNCLLQEGAGAGGAPRAPISVLFLRCKGSPSL